MFKSLVNSLFRTVLWFVFLAAMPLGAPLAAHGHEQRISLPMTIDYPLLNMLVRNSFLDGGSIAEVDEQKTWKTLLHEQDGCQRIVISAPCFREEAGALRMETQVHLRYGRSLGSFCVLPVTFDGLLVMNQIPSVTSADWTLRFTPGTSEVRTLDGQPARIASLAWGLIENHVLDVLAGITVNLGVPMEELQSFLIQVLSGDHPQEVLLMIQGMHPGEVMIQERGLKLENSMVVFDELYGAESESETYLEAYHAEDEMERFMNEWEVWDAFLVHLLISLAPEPLSEEEQWVLLDLLIRLRHDFLVQFDASGFHTDLVRSQFVEAWKTLAPLFRSQLLDVPSDSLLGYFAFFSASDALLALDELGPAVGLEISRDGLIRLTRLLDRKSETLLDYDHEMIPELQRILGIENDSSSGLELGPLSGIWNSLRVAAASILPATARADSPPPGLENKIDQWVFQGKELDQYMTRMTSVLSEQATIVVEKAKAPSPHHDFFGDLVLATAWQESCFRQFKVAGEQVLVLRSSNNTSVGIMQINERVWRGLYDQTRLRWDLPYNARVGSEILDLYFNKYARTRMESEDLTDRSPDFQAAMIYAMYNGGPRQLERFLTRARENSLQRSDRMFQQKWEWVRQDALDKISICLIGQ